MKKLISFITPSRRLDNIKGLLDNIEETVSDPGCVEVLIKFDDDQVEAIPFIEEEIKKRPFSIRYISTPRLEGIYSVWVAMEQLFFMTDPDCYFIQIISDEPRFLTKHWDLILRNYIGFYKDDVFRLRLSDVKCASYSSHYECTFKPDSFPIYTRRWLELTEGSGDCWGSDAYQQCVAFQLSLGPGSYLNIYREEGLCRDVPIYDIKLGGLEFCVGVSPEDQRDRHWRNLKEWSRLTTYPMQEHFSYLARRINAYVWANQQGVDKFKLIKNARYKTVSVVIENGEVIKEFSYAVPRLVVYAQGIFRYCVIKPRHSAVWLMSNMKLYAAKMVDSGQSKAVDLFFSSVRLITVFLIRVTHILRSLIRAVYVISSLIFGVFEFAAKAIYSWVLPRSYRKNIEIYEAWKSKMHNQVVRYKHDLKRKVKMLLGYEMEGVSHHPFSRKLSRRARVRMALRKMVSRILMPYNVVGSVIDGWFRSHPPGVSALYKRKPDMPRRIQPPTKEKVEWLRSELERQNKIRAELEGKIFESQAASVAQVESHDVALMNLG